MAKLNITVLVFCPDTQELPDLRQALEPVVARYREATSYREACQKSQNENMELYILGYGQAKAPVDVSDFYYFLRESSKNKMAYVYVWGPKMDERIDPKKDSKIRFFQKGKYKDLIESLDDFSKSNSLDYVAQKTKEALPFFMTHAISEVKEGFEKVFKHSLLVDELWKVEKPQIVSPVMGVIKARIIEGVFVSESLAPSVDVKELQNSLAINLDNAMKSSAEAVKMTDPQYRVLEIKDALLCKKELGEGSWKRIELRHAASSKPVAKVYLKIRPNPTPGII